MTRRGFWILVFALTVGAAALAHDEGASAAATGATIHYRAGWYLMAGSGQRLAGTVAEDLYTLQAGDTAYRVASARGTLQIGFGYWVYLTADGELTPSGGSDAPYQVTAPAGSYFLVGDPSGTQAATVTGADLVLIYDQASGYQQTATLQPGQGAWVMSRDGGTITITPAGGATGSSPAPATAARNLQTVSGANGYRFQVPADWQREPSPPSNIDVVVDSADKEEFAMVKVEPLPAGLPNASLVVPLNEYLQIVRAGLADYRLLQAPDVIAVAGADSAALAMLTYMSEHGDVHVSTILMARGGDNVYLFIVDVSGPYWNQNQDQVQQWLRSFQLTPPQ